MEVTKLQRDYDQQRDEHDQAVSSMREKIAQLEAQVLQAQERDDQRCARTIKLRERMREASGVTDMLVDLGAMYEAETAEVSRRCPGE